MTVNHSGTEHEFRQNLLPLVGSVVETVLVELVAGLEHKNKANMIGLVFADGQRLLRTTAALIDGAPNVGTAEAIGEVKSVDVTVIRDVDNKTYYVAVLSVGKCGWVSFQTAHPGGFERWYERETDAASWILYDEWILRRLAAV